MQLGNFKKASRYTRDLLQHDPYHERALMNQKYFDSVAVDEPDKFVDGEEEVELDPEHARYEQLCREPQPIVRSIHATYCTVYVLLPIAACVCLYVTSICIGLCNNV